jgi:hypothetical protein
MTYKTLFDMPDDTLLAYEKKFIPETRYGKLRHDNGSLIFVAFCESACAMYLNEWDIIDVTKYRLATKEEVSLFLLEN